MRHIYFPTIRVRSPSQSLFIERRTMKSHGLVRAFKIHEDMNKNKDDCNYFQLNMHIQVDNTVKKGELA